VGIKFGEFSPQKFWQKKVWQTKIYNAVCIVSRGHILALPRRAFIACSISARGGHAHGKCFAGKNGIHLNLQALL